MISPGRSENLSTKLLFKQVYEDSEARLSGILTSKFPVGIKWNSDQSVSLKQMMANFFVKGQIVHILGFVGSIASDLTTQLSAK